MDRDFVLVQKMRMGDEKAKKKDSIDQKREENYYGQCIRQGGYL